MERALRQESGVSESSFSLTRDQCLPWNKTRVSPPSPHFWSGLQFPHLRGEGAHQPGVPSDCRICGAKTQAVLGNSSVRRPATGDTQTPPNESSCVHTALPADSPTRPLSTAHSRPTSSLATPSQHPRTSVSLCVAGTGDVSTPGALRPSGWSTEGAPGRGPGGYLPQAR